MNGTLRLKWLQNFRNEDESFWFSLPSRIFLDFGGIEFLLKCDFEVSKLPSKLSKFDQQVLHYWKLIFEQNFSPRNTLIWTNRCIFIKKKLSSFKAGWNGEFGLFNTWWLTEVIYWTTMNLDVKTIWHAHAENITTLLERFPKPLSVQSKDLYYTQWQYLERTHCLLKIVFS